ncbi:MAG: replicative DNA helicase [candidate division Zixibacteria bacterium]|nr:replicative DNA helicase [candidate division Zixibacteria bacterium]
MERIPPHSQDAEQALLGAMLIDESAVARAVEILRQERRFYSAAHRKIFAAITGLYERSQPADITTVAEELERLGELADCGGRAYLAGLASGVATAANAEYYARIILEKSTLRDLIEASSDIVNQAYRQEKEVDDLLDEAEQKVFDISEGQLRSDFSRVADLLPHTFESIESYVETKGGLIGYSTGYTDLDGYTAGLHRGDLIIIAGRPSMGKSALVLNIAENLSLSANKAAAVFSLEMSKEQLALRMLCGRAKVSSHRLRTGRMSESDWPKLSNAAGPLEKALIYIDDTPSMTVLEMRAKARRLASQQDLGLVVVDYIQMMTGSRHAENRQQEISQISRGLKALAKELGVPVIGCSQLSRMVETRGGDRRPQLSDLRESGAIEQDADVVMFVYRPEYYLSGLDAEDPKLLEVKGRAEIIIAKQRNGPTGTVTLSFLKDFARFENLAAGYGVPSEASVPF